MAASIKSGVFSWGFTGTEKNIRAMKQGEGVIIAIEGSYAQFAGDRGKLGPKLAAMAVAHIKTAIETGGSGIAAYQPEITDAWKKRKAKLGLESRAYMATGTLYKNIKVLSRRSGAGRYSTAGIDKTKKVARINGAGMVSVAAYAADIEFGIQGRKPKLLITLAMHDFLTRKCGEAARRAAGEFVQYSKTLADNMDTQRGRAKIAIDKGKVANLGNAAIIKAMRDYGYTTTAIEYAKHYLAEEGK